MDDERSGSGGGWTSGMGVMGEYMVIGVVFPVALVGGFFLGWWIGGLLGSETVGAFTGLGLGTVAAFYNLFETLQRIQRREAAAAAKDAHAAEDAEDEEQEGRDG